MGGGPVLTGRPQGAAQGTTGGSKAVGHVAYCPRLHPKRDRPKSSPEPGPREADRLWGPERAAPRALTQALEAAGPRPFPSRSLPGLLTCRGPGSVGQLSEASLFLEYTSSSSRPHPGLALRLPPSGILSPGRLSQQSHCTQSVLAQSHRLRVPSLITRPTLLTPRAPGGAVTTTTRCFQTGRGRVPVLLSAGAKQTIREGSCRGQACSRPHSPTVGLGPGSAGSQPQGLARAAGKVSTGQRHPKAGLRPGMCPRQGPPTALPAGRGCLPAAAGHVGLPSSGSQWWQLCPPGPGLRARSEGARASRLSFCHSVLEMVPGRFCRARQ